MNAGDAHHRDAVTLVRRAAIAGDLIAHPLTIAESAVGAAEHGRLQQVRDAFAGLGLATGPGDPDQPWRLAELRARTRLALPDCCVLDVALESQGALATFDVRLDQLLDEPLVYLALRGNAGTLRLIWAPEVNAFTLEDDQGRRVSAPLVRRSGDLITFGICQTPTMRRTAASNLASSIGGHLSSCHRSSPIVRTDRFGRSMSAPGP